MLALGADFDPEALVEQRRPGRDSRSASRSRATPAEIEGVLDKIRAPDGPPRATFLTATSDGDAVAIGPDDDYRAELLEDGGLGDSEAFQNVVREADDAASILFVNFDAGDDWLAELAGDDPEAADNLEPLQGLGISAWVDGRRRPRRAAADHRLTAPQRPADPVRRSPR